jgi:hypothetical protein
LRGFLADHRGVAAGLVVAVLVVAGVVAGKVLADRAATRQTSARAEEVERLLRGASPEDFLALNAERVPPGTLARRVRNQPDLVAVRAGADRSVLRFQPDGWWSGFTERCVVAVVGADGVEVRVPKTACVRVEVPG